MDKAPCLDDILLYYVFHLSEKTVGPKSKGLSREEEYQVRGARTMFQNYYRRPSVDVVAEDLQRELLVKEVTRELSDFTRDHIIGHREIREEQIDRKQVAKKVGMYAALSLGWAGAVYVMFGDPQLSLVSFAIPSVLGGIYLAKTIKANRNPKIRKVGIKPYAQWADAILEEPHTVQEAIDYHKDYIVDKLKLSLSSGTCPAP